MSDVEISLENIGGLLDETNFDLKKGLNYIEAPNAEGKTSFVEGLLALVLPEDTLREKRYFLHYLADSGKVILRLNGNKFERRLVSRGPNALTVTGSPMHAEGGKVSFFAFALPDSELLRMIESGQSLQEKFTEFSDARYYTLAADWFKLEQEEVHIALSRLKEEEESIRRLEEDIKRREREIEDFGR